MMERCFAGLIEKNGLRSPCEARATWNQSLMKVAA
jgi:hypothetical protein